MNDRTTKWETHLRAGAMVAVLFVAASAGAATPTDMWIRVTSTSSFNNATKGRYTITVSNRGTAATDAAIHVTDILPDGLSFFSGTGRGWQCTAAGQTVDCVRSDALRAGSASSVRLKVIVCTTATELTNSINVVYPADTNPANNTITRTTIIQQGLSCTVSTATPTGPTATATAVTTGTLTPTTATPTPSSTPTATPGTAAATDLQIVKTTGSTFTVGSNGLYVLTVSNLGAASTNDTISVVDSLPSGLSLVSASGSGWSCSASGQTASCMHAGALAPGLSTSFTVVVSVGDAAYPTVTNTAILTYAGDTDSSNNIARKPTTIRQ